MGSVFRTDRAGSHQRFDEFAVLRTGNGRKCADVFQQVGKQGGGCFAVIALPQPFGARQQIVGRKLLGGTKMCGNQRPEIGLRLGTELK